jgi:hypothetical protein
VLVHRASAEQLQGVRRSAAGRGVPLALDTTEMFGTGHDADNRAAVAAVPTERLDIVGVGLRAPHRDANALLRGLERHP